MSDDVREKKIQIITDWLETPESSAVRYKNLIVFASESGNDGVDICIWTENDLVRWFNAAKDHEIATACAPEAAFVATMPKSRTEPSEDANE